MHQPIVILCPRDVANILLPTVRVEAAISFSSVMHSALLTVSFSQASTPVQSG